jgi:hypothetical protein
MFGVSFVLTFASILLPWVYSCLDPTSEDRMTELGVPKRTESETPIPDLNFFFHSGVFGTVAKGHWHEKGFT